MSEEKTHDFWLELKTLIERGDMESADDLLTDEALQVHQHPSLYLFKCVITRHFERDAQEVIDAAEQGLALEPNYIDLIDFKFIAQLALEKLAEAAETGLLLCHHQPHNYEAHYATATVLEQSGWPNEALSVRAQGHYAAAMAYSRGGRKDSALEELDKTLALDDSHGRAKMKRVQVLLTLGRREEAEALLHKYQYQESIAIDALTLLCQLAEGSNDVDYINLYSKAILAADEGNSYALRVQVKLARSVGKAEDIFDTLEEGLKHHPDDLWCNLSRFSYSHELSSNTAFLSEPKSHRSFWRLMDVLLDTDMTDAAIEKITGNIQDSPEFVVDLITFCEKLAQNKLFGKLQSLLDGLSDYCWDRAELHCFYAEALANNESFNSAITYIEKKEKGFTDSALVAWTKAKLIVKKSLHCGVTPLSPELIPSFEKAVIWRIESRPKDAEAMYVYGALFCFKEQYGDAEEWISKARKAGLKDVTSAYWKAKALYELGEVEEALETFEDEFEKRKIESFDISEHLVLKSAILKSLEQNKND